MKLIKNLTLLAGLAAPLKAQDTTATVSATVQSGYTAHGSTLTTKPVTGIQANLVGAKTIGNTPVFLHFAPQYVRSRSGQTADLGASVAATIEDQGALYSVGFTHAKQLGITRNEFFSVLQTPYLVASFTADVKKGTIAEAQARYTTPAIPLTVSGGGALAQSYHGDQVGARYIQAGASLALINKKHFTLTPAVNAYFDKSRTEPNRTIYSITGALKPKV
jgi:hypothetical protein